MSKRKPRPVRSGVSASESAPHLKVGVQHDSPFKYTASLNSPLKVVAPQLTTTYIIIHAGQAHLHWIPQILADQVFVQARSLRPHYVRRTSIIRLEAEFYRLSSSKFLRFVQNKAFPVDALGCDSHRPGPAAYTYLLSSQPRERATSRARSSS